MRFVCAFLLHCCFGLSIHAITPTPSLVVEQDRQRILQAATQALQLQPPSLVQHQSALHPGSKHEFFSMSDYYWPDPAKPDGKPYLMRDGQSNPGNFNEHREALMAMRDATSALAAAFLLTQDEQYARKAVEILRVFFLDENSRMHPSLDYAQTIIGKATPDRGTGLIDTLHLIEVPLAILALQNSKAMTPEISDGLRQWFADYTQWFIKSSKGRNEAKAKNNHAVAYWLQVSAFATLTKDEDLLAEGRRQFKEVFVSVQMAEDGSFPLELGRTKPYAYSIFQLDLMAALAQLLSTPQDNLWTYSSAQKKSMAKALAYLYPYLKDKSSWPKPPDVNAWDGWPVRQPALLFGGLALRDDKYVKLWQALKPDPQDFEIRRNNPITQPLLWTSLKRNSPLTKRVRAKDVFQKEGALLFSDNFQNPLLTSWRFSEDNRYDLAQPTPERIRVVEAPHLPQSSKAIRFEVNRAPNCFRAEISLPHEEGFQQRWYAAKIFVPEDWVIDPARAQDIVIQWHGIPGNWRPTYPNLSIAIRGEDWVISRSSGSPQKGPDRALHRLEKTLERGKWVSWIIHAKWSPTADGLLEIWKDGEQVLRHQGPNVYGTIGVNYTPYMKTGIYRPEWHLDDERKRLAFENEMPVATRKIIYVSDVKVGGPEASLQDFVRVRANQ